MTFETTCCQRRLQGQFRPTRARQLVPEGLFPHCSDDESPDLPAKKMDEAAFPVRLRIVVPPRGLGRLLDTMHEWLRTDVGTGNFASHSSAGLGCQGMAIYFRTVADARRFTDAFPQVALADGIKAVSYSSPYRSPSRSLEPSVGVNVGSIDSLSI